jgi:hypothetical protein
MFIFVALLMAAVLILLAMGRPPICTCGAIEPWGEVGPKQSQMLADFYSPSHVIHGFLFYALLHLVWRKGSIGAKLGVATLIEAGWEIAENTQLMIDRYREATIALGYSGDSVLNSASDMVMMGIGFALARRLPTWASVTLVLALELIPLIAIRDNLTLNVLMLITPSDAIRAWQAGA